MADAGSRDGGRRAGVSAVVVDDSRFMRRLIGDLLTEAGIEVVGTAADGADAVETVAAQRPDVVTMDQEMPGMSGVEAVERIMAECPTPVLMLSAYTEADADVTFEALDRGAVDFFAKPGGEVSAGVERHRERLVETVLTVAEADLSNAASDATGTDAPPSGATDTSSTASEAPSAADGADEPAADGESLTVVLAASTGGPDAVERVMAELPGDADLRVLVVQHMPAAFTSRFAERLDDASALTVSEATDGARIGAGEALVAHGDAHLELSSYRSGRLRVSFADDRDASVTPAADVTMRSAAETVEDRLLGVVLTGMGDDAAAGSRAIADAGGRVIAQDADSAVVDGMPKRARETGCVDEVLPLAEVAGGVTREVT